jgi:hypothetical protein
MDGNLALEIKSQAESERTAVENLKSEEAAVLTARPARQ